MRQSAWRTLPEVGLLLVAWALGCAGPGEPGARSRSAAGAGLQASDARPEPPCDVLVQASELSPSDAAKLLPGAVAALRARPGPDARAWVYLLLLRAPLPAPGEDEALEALAAAGGQGERAGSVPVERLLRGLLEERRAGVAALGRAEDRLQEERLTAQDLRSLLAKTRLGLDAGREQVEALKRSRDEAVARLGSLQAALDEERRRAADLKDQLEQLKAIEKILERREGPPPGEGTR